MAINGLFNPAVLNAFGSQFVIVIRYILLGCSILSAFALLVFGAVSGRAFDVVQYTVLFFLIINAFYILLSRSTLRTSDILTQASTRIALFSLELHHQAQEAQIREVEAEKRRLAEAEHNQFKLQVARDILLHLCPALLLDGRLETDLAQVEHQVDLKNHSLPLPVPAPLAAEGDRRVNGHDIGDKSAQLVVYPKATSTNFNS